jgi:hypothetical protein
MGKKVYDVTFTVDSNPTEYVQRIALWEGYSTEAHIPTIIAMARSGHAPDAARITVLDKVKVN